MADAKVSALSSITPVDTDVLYVVDDPGGTPVSAKATISAVLALAPGAAGGTDVAVADGGTGASTASGAATNLGLGAGNSPQFTAINLGHASDTTLHRVSAGVVAVEGATLAKLTDIASGTITARSDDINLSGGTDGDVLTVQADGSLAFEAPPGAAGGDAWSDPVNSDIIPDADGTRAVGSATLAFAQGHFDSVFIGGTQLDGTTLADPGADRLVFWDDSAGQIAYLTASTGLVLSGTTITVDFTGYIQGLVDDTTPQLGGNLDLNGSFVGDASAADLTKLSELTTTSAKLNSLTDAFTPADSAGPASLQFHEDTDSGTNKITIIAPSVIESDFTLTLPEVTGTLITDQDLGSALGDPNVDSVLFWDDSANQMEWLTPGAGLVISGTSMTVDMSAVATDTLTVGFDATSFNAGTKSSGTYTPAAASGNFQHAVNGGAHTLAPPTTSCCIVIQYTNNATAGAITTSGFTKVTGDSFTTTDGHDFLCHITRCNGFTHLHVTALQ